MGERKAVALLREVVEMLDGIEALIRDEKIDCAFVRCGRFRGAMLPQHYEAMARDMKDLRRYAGVESFVVPRGEQSHEIETFFTAARFYRWMQAFTRETIMRA